MTAAFTFSRLPREQRIAKTLSNVVSKLVGVSFNNTTSMTMNEGFFLDVATELEPYARKDFVVRYGHLEDGNGKA